MQNLESQLHALQMVIKCADIGHLAAYHTTHRQWSLKLEEEFFRQVGSLLYFMTLSISLILSSLLCFFRHVTTLCIEIEYS